MRRWRVLPPPSAPPFHHAPTADGPHGSGVLIGGTSPHPLPIRSTTPRPPTVPTAPASSLAATRQPPPPNPSPQPLCFGTLPPSLLAPDSHLPLYPSAPPPPACGVDLSAAQTANNGAATRQGGSCGRKAEVLPRRWSTECRNGRATRTLHHHDPTAGAPGVHAIGQRPQHAPPRSTALHPGRSGNSDSDDCPGTRLQTFILENYRCPVVWPLIPSKLQSTIWISQTNGDAPASTSIVASGLNYHFCSPPEFFSVAVDLPFIFTSSVMEDVVKNHLIRIGNFRYTRDHLSYPWSPSGGGG